MSNFLFLGLAIPLTALSRSAHTWYFRPAVVFLLFFYYLAAPQMRYMYVSDACVVFSQRQKTFKGIGHLKWKIALEEALLWIMNWYFSWKQQFEVKMMMDLFLTDTQLFASQDVNWWCGLLWCFYQLFGLESWRHPFTAEDPLVNKWCNAIHFSKSVLMKKQTHLHLGCPEGEL